MKTLNHLENGNDIVKLNSMAVNIGNCIRCNVIISVQHC